MGVKIITLIIVHLKSRCIRNRQSISRKSIDARIENTGDLVENSESNYDISGSDQIVHPSTSSEIREQGNHSHDSPGDLPLLTHGYNEDQIIPNCKSQYVGNGD